MKKIFLLLMVIVVGLSVNAQPNYSRINSGYNWLRGAFDELTIPAGDNPALSSKQWVRAGAMYIDTTGGNAGAHYWNGSAWVRIYDTTNQVGGTYKNGLIDTSGVVSLGGEVEDSIRIFGNEETLFLEEFGNVIINAKNSLSLGAKFENYIWNEEAYGSIALGSNNTITGGEGNITIGSGNSANGFLAIAIGEANHVSDDVSIAIGFSDSSLASSSIALGQSMTVAGIGSVGFNIGGGSTVRARLTQDSTFGVFAINNFFKLNADSIWINPPARSGSERNKYLTIDTLTGRWYYADGGSGASSTFANGLTLSSDTVKLGGTLTDSAIIKTPHGRRIEFSDDGYVYEEDSPGIPQFLFALKDTVSSSGYFDSKPTGFFFDRQIYYPNYITSDYRSGIRSRMLYTADDSVRIRTFGGDFFSSLRGEIKFTQEPGATGQTKFRNFNTTTISEGIPAINAVAHTSNLGGSNSVRVTGALAGFTTTFITTARDTVDTWVQFSGSSSFHEGQLTNYIGLYLEPPNPGSRSKTTHRWGILQPWDWVPSYHAGQFLIGADSSRLRPWRFGTTGLNFFRDSTKLGPRDNFRVTDTTGLMIQAWRPSDSLLVSVPAGVFAGGGSGSVSFGSDNQIPYTNSGGTDFDYLSGFTFNGTTLALPQDISFNGGASALTAYAGGTRLRFQGITGSGTQTVYSILSPDGTDSLKFVSDNSGGHIYDYTGGLTIRRSNSTQLTFGSASITSAVSFLPRTGGTAAGSAPIKFTSGTLMTTAEAGSHEYNGAHYLTNVNAIRYGVGGSLVNNVTSVATVGTGEDNLQSYTLPASVLVTNNDYIEIEATFTVMTNAVVKLYFGATVVAQYDNTGGPNSEQMTFRGRITRTGATAQVGFFTLVGGVSDIGRGFYTVPAETLSGTIVIKGTGEGTADNDVTMRNLNVKYYPNN